ncbi:MAG: hypothetical protein L6R40_002652 [Gallowayella cf. fulva]|nr:MAG: hypothetical protein L6R40_002652 [Xanthomendoza cf. fulva]
MFPRADVFLLSSTLLLSMLSVTAATNIDNALQRRQNFPVGTGASASVSPSSVPTVANPATSSQNPPSSSENSPNTPSSTSAEQTPNDRSDDSSSPSTATASSSVRDFTSPGSTSTVQDSTASGPRPTTTSAFGAQSGSKTDQTQSRSVSSRTQQFVTTVVTVSGSSTRTNVVTTSGLKAVSTFASTSTSAPSLNGNQSGSSKSGLDSSQKRIVIGVVVGIGGAILLGGIAVVAWRIWGRKGRAKDDDNDLMGSHPGSSGREKRSSISGQSPFRSTLDQYHNQHGPVNTASNF